MPTLERKKVRDISIQYLASEEELDSKKPLEVGKGLSDNFIRTEDLGYITTYGVKRYLCGLDREMINYNQDLTDEQKKAKIEEIDVTVKRLEEFFGKGQLEPTNSTMWSKVKLFLDKKVTPLDLSNPKTEIIIYCIKAGGFKTVAPSMDEAMVSGAKFYLVEPEELAESRVANRKIIDKATAALVKLDDTKGFDDIFMIGKFLLPIEKGYSKKTPKAMIYSDLSKYLDGEVVRDSKINLAETFLNATKLSKADLLLTCLVKDGLNNSILYINPQGEIKNNETGGTYGTTIERAAAHLQNPVYEDELENLKTRVEKKWSE